ncbi:hypothetical protein JAAARDRAFT_135995 [Jaapia argillacea MUCL 33604]|uniref:HAT C-terminal dimerisation domain-containing protein n=1 Tax=Jaapia argillacea MUCL 33604 TaxID=933084 RepID=A0A067PK40_9AGAM|nr:hypothetical protein JAAARDRAFT_135995 [Jaapia argillacea MUCL 33604]
MFFSSLYTCFTTFSPFRKLNAHRFPMWASLAWDYLTIMATSISSERAFSSASIAITKGCNRLKGDIIKALQALKCAFRNNLFFYNIGPSSTTEDVKNHTVLRLFSFFLLFDTPHGYLILPYMGSSSITIIFLLNTRDGYISLQHPSDTSSFLHIQPLMHYPPSIVTLIHRHLITSPSSTTRTINYGPLCL